MAKPEPLTGTVKVRIEFGEDGSVIKAEIIEKTGGMRKTKPEDDRIILEKIRKWKVPGHSGVAVLPIRFTSQ